MRGECDRSAPGRSPEQAEGTPVGDGAPGCAAVSGGRSARGDETLTAAIDPDASVEELPRVRPVPVGAPPPLATWVRAGYPLAVYLIWGDRGATPMPPQHWSPDTDAAHAEKCVAESLSGDYPPGSDGNMAVVAIVPSGVGVDLYGQRLMASAEGEGTFRLGPFHIRGTRVDGPLGDVQVPLEDQLAIIVFRRPCRSTVPSEVPVVIRLTSPSFLPCL